MKFNGNRISINSFLAVVFVLMSLNGFGQNWLWAKNAIGVQNSSDCCMSVSSDSLDNAYMTGYFQAATIKFGTITLNNPQSSPPSGPANIFTAKYDQNGNVIWAKPSFGNTLVEFDTGISSDKQGNSYIVGNYSTSISFGNYTLTSSGNQDIYITKYDTDGNVLWALTAGGSQIDQVRSVKYDGQGAIYITGYFNSPVFSIGSQTISNTGISNIYIAKLDINGNVLWLKREGMNGYDRGTFVTTDNSGNIYLYGAFTSSILTIGSYSITNNLNSNLFITKYNSSGNVIWVKSCSYADNVDCNSMYVDDNENVYLTGAFLGSKLSMENDTLYNKMYVVSSNDKQMFLFKLDKVGNLKWAEASNNYYSPTFVSGYTITKRRNGVMIGAFCNNVPIAFQNDTIKDVPYGGDTMILVEYDSLGNVIKALRSMSGAQWVGACTDSKGNSLVAGSFLVSPFIIGTTTLYLPGGNYYPNVYIAKYSQQTIGLNELTFENNFVKVYPNPAQDEIEINFSEQSPKEIRIFDFLGREVETIKQVGKKTIINISDLKFGCYFIEADFESGLKSNKKFIKQ